MPDRNALRDGLLQKAGWRAAPYALTGDYPTARERRGVTALSEEIGEAEDAEYDPVATGKAMAAEAKAQTEARF